MEVITAFLVIAGLGGLILQYWKNEPAFTLLTEILAIGGLACVIGDYSNGLMEQNPALVLVITMVAVMLWSIWNFTQYYWPGKKRR